MQVFRTLGSDQQQQILRQLGMGNGALSTQGSASDLADRLGLQDNSAQRERQQRQRQEKLEERLPILRPLDSVVVEVDTQPLTPRPADTTEAIYAAMTAGTLSTGAGGYYAPGGQPSPQSASQLSPQQLQMLLQQQQLQTQQQPQQQQQQQQQSQSSSTQAQAIPQGWQTGSPDLMAALDPQRLTQLRALIRSKNPYQLTSDGVLWLPGFAAIPLAGLSEVQATLRLEVEPALRGLYFRITKLPLTKSGLEGLKPFGYDLFENPPSTFAPMTSIPLPADYVVGAGDELEVELYGNQNSTFTLTVGRDGRVNFPQLGPISVAGQRFLSVKETLEGRVARQMIGVKASVSMGYTRAIRVFVLGEAEAAGTYTVSGLATITSALYAAGGVKRIGSLRDIQLKRQGQVVRHLDLYDLLIRGDTTDDARLLPGDAIFIPPVGATVSIEGEVRRPAIYELRHEANVGDLVLLAGGLTPDAESTTAMLTRVDERQERIVLRADLASASGRALGLRNGDALRISRLRPTLDSGVVLEGHVYTPGSVAFRQGMRLTDVIHSVDELRPNADLHYVLIRREMPPDRRIEAFSADLEQALEAPSGSADIALTPRDRIIVFDLESGRDRVIQPLLTELQLQSNFGRPAEVVRIDGRVKVPGEYPLEPRMRVSDLIRAGGSLSEAAYGGQAELARYTIVNGSERQTDLIKVDLAAALKGDPKADLELKPFDSLSIKELSLWGDQEQVTLRGQVRFPGVYTVKQGETLKSVLQRAGGLTEYAFAQGGVFIRQDLKVREQQQLDLLAQRTQSDITAMALQGAAAGTINGNGGGGSGTTALAVGQSLLTQLKSVTAVGRLVIDLPNLMSKPAGSQYDVVLRNGDQLLVPRFQQEVTVIGEVQSTTSHLYRSSLTRDDYIQLSGGMTRRADTSKIYVVRADGSVVAGESAHFFRSGSQGPDIRAGDTIVVPMNTEKLPAITEWQAITSILYNLAVATAAVHAVGVF
jgi:protein involved in polysaccharide export with SLBB domain